MLALAALLLQGCNAIKLVYNAAPTASYWWLDGYLDFDASQGALLRQELDGLHHWHRSTQLPEYARLLQRAQVLVGAEQVTPAQACTLVADVRREIGHINRPAGASAAALVASLAPEQLAHMQAQYAKNNAKFRKEWIDISPQEMREKRYATTLERAERIYGRLQAPQRAIVREQVAASSFDPRMQQAERLRRQQDTLQVLRGLLASQAAPEPAARALGDLLERYAQSPDPALRAYTQRQLDEGCASFAVAHNMATPAQREHAVKRLKAYEQDVRDLAAQQR